MRLGLEHCINHKLLPVTLETDSLGLKNIIDRLREVPQTISMEVKNVNVRRAKVPNQVEVTDTLREGNKVAEIFC